jgi:hypothetical protein
LGGAAWELAEPQAMASKKKPTPSASAGGIRVLHRRDII